MMTTNHDIGDGSADDDVFYWDTCSQISVIRNKNNPHLENVRELVNKTETRINGTFATTIVRHTYEADLMICGVPHKVRVDPNAKANILCVGALEDDLIAHGLTVSKPVRTDVNGPRVAAEIKDRSGKTLMTIGGEGHMATLN